MLNNGDADLLLALGEDERPTNYDQADWYSMYKGSDNLIVSL